MKISVIGIGRVGATLAYSILIKGLCSELVLVGRSEKVAKGEAFDLQHAQPFLAKQMDIRQGAITDTENSDIIVITASVPTNPRMSSRLELSTGNVALFEDIVPKLASVSPQAILVIVSNPVDLLAYAAIKYSGFASNRVIGTGTLIDSARYRPMLSSELDIHPDDVRAYILGEHGETQFPAISLAQAGGVRIRDTDNRRHSFEQAVDAGFKVFRHKGHTNFAISLATCTFLEAIIYNTKRTMPASVLISDYYDVNDVCLSVPVVIGREGILRILQPDFSDLELTEFRKSAAAVRREIETFFGS